MAKGVEDTTYYRWNRMVNLNEVGGDPLAVDSPTRDHLHAWARRQAASHPFGMTTLSTHDTKRSEDVRARLLAVAEDLEGWDAVADAVLGCARDCGVDAPTGYFVAQTLIGAWPLSEDRLVDYLLKAVREAKQHTSWNDPDEDYQERVGDLARRCVGDGAVAAMLDEVLRRNGPAFCATTLGAKLLQLTMPGVPDVYQGSELVELSLVDPDNRRPVDYERRTRLLSSLDDGDGEGAASSDGDLDADKLLVTATVLRLRRERPDLFDAASGYTALDAASPHLLGFVRNGCLATVVTRWPGLLARKGWGGARCELPAGDWTDLLSRRTHAVEGDGVAAEELFRDLPVALLLKDAS
jgi:(1->4)-alpha-D-glucan 1-alpha-D-glucosylmutase